MDNTKEVYLILCGWSKSTSTGRWHHDQLSPWCYPGITLRAAINYEKNKQTK